MKSRFDACAKKRNVDDDRSSFLSLKFSCNNVEKFICILVIVSIVCIVFFAYKNVFHSRSIMVTLKNDEYM